MLRGIASRQVLFMQSDGGLTDVADFSGHKAILSGPAGTVRLFQRYLDEAVLPCLRLRTVVSCLKQPQIIGFMAVTNTWTPGGVIGYGLTTYPQFKGAPVVGFDMGGTSTGLCSSRQPFMNSTFFLTWQSSRCIMGVEQMCHDTLAAWSTCLRRPSQVS